MASVDSWSSDAFSPHEFEDPAYDPGPAVSIRSLKPALRRRKRLWIATALIGLVGGASLHLMLPKKVATISTLYLVEPAGSTTAIQNDVSLLETRAVAEKAVGILHPGTTQPVFGYKAAAQGTSILSIKVSASSAAESLAENKALDTAFLTTRAQLESQQTAAQINSLTVQLQERQADYATVAGGSAISVAKTNQLGYDIGQIGSLQDQIAQVKSNQSSTTQDSAVLDQPYLVPVSAKKTALKDGLTGLVAGLALGMIIVIVGELLSDDVRRRVDVAAALGAPVELSVGRLP
jgi:hypothetical protein